ncbi:phenylacetic acid degradation protein [Sphingomonas sp. Leaf357]|uniref:PaaI family thioesterase n=1 Tax=Sphingomonas sp. Leaf357 TaxID=1736350 RepID=UPI0006F2D9B3|nr:PaaI family thioesterase [Sphingomonas sp. Leaf357]KQS04104.1 phenylacetic acid degradation protein [Sphingomonas sp. Leaf357]
MTSPLFSFDDDPDLPGWKRWQFRDPTRYNSFIEPLQVRIDGDLARVRMVPRREHSNMRDAVHGGALLGFMDVALFAAARAFGVLSAGGAVTLDLSAQFIGAGTIDEPLEAHIELLRETKRMLFLRGLIVQKGLPTIASFTGTLRKASPTGGAA